ncbi:MAG: hypothetical protein FWG55_00460 [Candidatus Bathyarchaeota archaeon]|nr:hypothetical protein [Candidatus Termiticorpusculum sp.]
MKEKIVTCTTCGKTIKIPAHEQRTQCYGCTINPTKKLAVIIKQEVINPNIYVCAKCEKLFITPTNQKRKYCYTCREKIEKEQRNTEYVKK